MRRDRPAKATPQSNAEAAYRRFLEHQKEGLQKWAKKRAAQLDSVGMSAEMEVLVIDLLEELREEPAALASTTSVHAGTETLLLRALAELKFVERFARQAVAIVLAREGEGVEGGTSLLARPGLLSECLDWLCVHVPIGELPLQFRPKLRLARTSAPKLATSSSVNSGGVNNGVSADGSGGGNSGGGISLVAGARGALTQAPAPPPRPWACSACTFENGAEASSCEICTSPKPPPLTKPERASEEGDAISGSISGAEMEMRAEEAEAAEAVARAQLQRLCAFGFARSRCIVRLAEATEGGGGGGGDCEEVALAALLRETLEKLATTLPSAMTSAANGPGQVAPTVAQDGASTSAMTSATAAGRMAAARAASARLAGLERLRRLVLAPEMQSEAHEMQSEAHEMQSELREMQAEEEAALGAILGPEFRQTAGGSVLTLLWDASTGEPLIASDCA
jgi:hypothetical protein